MCASLLCHPQATVAIRGVVTAANAMLDDMVGGLRQRFPEHKVLLWDANRVAVS
jgi:hypothetical protein